MKQKKIAYLGLFLALALICSYVESLIPVSIGIPGVKLGLTNVVVILMLYTIGAREAFLISMLRILLAGFLFGNLFSILYSMAGGILSFFCMLMLKRTGLFRMISVSAAGGIAHNLGQLIVAILVVESKKLIYYFPVLLLAGVLTGIVIGVVAQEILLRLPRDL